jgi:octaprenyl-diphosphate synthase
MASRTLPVVQPGKPLMGKLAEDEKVAKDIEQVARDSASFPEVLAALYAPIREQLDEVELILRDEFRNDHPFVDRLTRHGFRLGGTRLRPALVLLSGKVSGTLRPEHRVLAAAVEMIHTATLIHDDVLDEATLRRHLQTVNARWDNEASVLLGDYLLARSIRMASALEDPLACRAIGEAAQTMCEGELRQIETRGNYDLSEEDYLEIIANKTAALTACCCRLGSHYAGAEPSACRSLTRFGQHLGMAFQIADDLLDVLGDEATAGKSLGTDLAKQKPTLPLIRLLNRAGRQDRAELLEILSRPGNHHRRALRPWFDRSDAISYARDTALRYARGAVDELEGLPLGPLRKALWGLSDFVVTRRQ